MGDTRDQAGMKDATALRLVRWVHTIAWAFFASAVVVIPVAAWRLNFKLMALAIAAVLVESLVLAVNGMRCPLTGVAARYTADRRDNFDIYLPLIVARYNKQIFGWLFVAGAVFGIARWLIYIR